jgi:hypothetical protein
VRGGVGRVSCDKKPVSCENDDFSPGVLSGINLPTFR